MIELIRKARRLGLKLGIKKLLGYEAIFSWAYRERVSGQELYESEGTNRTFLLVPHSNEFWYADPLIYEYRGQHIVFMECMDRHTERGKIGYVELGTEKMNAPVIVIDEPYHMSFPTVFEWNEELYMLPETEMNSSIVLYHCQEFPGKWEKVGEYLHGRKIVDSVIMNIDTCRVQIIASEFNSEDAKQTSFCRYDLLKKANDIYVQWVGRITEEYTYESRMAGPIIEKRMIPLQRSTPGIYGYSTKFYQWENGEIRKCVKEILPENIKSEKKGLLGTHTYSQSSKFEVIDVEYLVYNKHKWKHVRRNGQK